MTRHWVNDDTYMGRYTSRVRVSRHYSGRRNAVCAGEVPRRDLSSRTEETAEPSLKEISRNSHANRAASQKKKQVQVMMCRACRGAFHRAGETRSHDATFMTIAAMNTRTVVARILTRRAASCDLWFVFVIFGS